MIYLGPGLVGMIEDLARRLKNKRVEGKLKSVSIGWMHELNLNIVKFEYYKI